MYGLKDEQWELVKHILQSNPKLDEAILFGSRAKGNFRPGSDVDIALKGRALQLEDILSLSNQLEDTYLPYIFDLALFHHIKDPDMIDHINRVGISIYKK